MDRSTDRKKGHSHTEALTNSRRDSNRDKRTRIRASPNRAIPNPNLSPNPNRPIPSHPSLVRANPARVHPIRRGIYRRGNCCRGNRRAKKLHHENQNRRERLRHGTPRCHEMRRLRGSSLLRETRLRRETLR